MEKIDVLVVGGGGREHAIVKKIHDQHPEVKLFVAPGNPGIAQIAECVPIQPMMIDRLVAFADAEGIGLTVVGPEAPLAAGIRDQFSEAGLKLFGPTQAAAMIESDKELALNLMRDHEIPTGWFRVFASPQAAFEFVECKGCPVVVKNPYLAGGKGSFVCFNPQEVLIALTEIQKQQKGRPDFRFIIMQYLQGQEVSITAITDAVNAVWLAPSQDHKRILDGDQGPMTGGMGAIAPAPFITSELQAEIHEKIILRTIRAMAEEGRPYVGVLYAGLMLTAKGPRVLEFNCRFGDPEAQGILPLADVDILELMLAACEGRLKDIEIPPPRRAAACVVAASAGYPGTYQTSKLILGLGQLANWYDLNVFHAGTCFCDDGQKMETAGGRVLGVVGLGDNLPAAIARAYQAMGQLYFDGMHYRRDIGHHALDYLRRQAAP